MTNKDVAKKLLKLFGPKGQGFVTGRIASNGTDAVLPEDPAAIKWCFYGGLCKLKQVGSRSRFHTAMTRTFDGTDYLTSTWNDTVGWIGVKRALLKISKTGRINRATLGI
jgi:hypothetical protein